MLSGRHLAAGLFVLAPKDFSAIGGEDLAWGWALQSYGRNVRIGRSYRRTRGDIAPRLGRYGNFLQDLELLW